MPAPSHTFVALLLAFAIAAAPYAKASDVSAGIAKDMADLQEALKDVSADVKDKINTNVLQLLVDTLKAAGADDTAAAIASPGGSGSRSGGSSGSSVIPVHEQCGGQGPDGTYGCRNMGTCADAAYPGKSCAAGSSCTRQDNWYWQCKPSGGNNPSNPSNPSGGNSIIPAYEQCGGQGPDGTYGCRNVGTCADAAYPGRSCAAGSSCVRQDNWYWQCKPGSAGGSRSASSSVSSTPATAPKTTLALWGQCGGKGGECSKYQCVDGPFTTAQCPAGATCQKQNDWYYQCICSNGVGPDGNSCNTGSAGGSRSGGSSGSSPSPIPQWEQCGGKGPDGTYGCRNIGSCSDAPYTSRSCPAGNTCTRHSEWYWQCMPGGSNNNQPNNNNSQPISSVDKWGQCGGKGGECQKLGECSDKAVRGCNSSSCQRQSEWYWQCM